MDVTLVRDPDRLPEITDREEHEIVQVCLCDSIGEADPLDDRFVISFTCADGKVLRIRLPASELQALGEGLLRMAKERNWRGKLTLGRLTETLTHGLPRAIAGHSTRSRRSPGG
jgi:hypothetical protein